MAAAAAAAEVHWRKASGSSHDESEEAMVYGATQVRGMGCGRGGVGEVVWERWF